MGHNFSKDDAGYLVHLYEEHGEEFFKMLNGQFSGLIIDKRNNTTFLFNDRFGFHRLFTHRTKDSFFFSSEAKAILKVCPETRDFDLNGVSEYLTCGCTLGENSLFKDIKVLPGATCLKFINGNLYKKYSYFNPEEWENLDSLSADNFTSSFTEKFYNIISRYTNPLGKVGLSVTGGIDSRLVIAAVNPAPGSFPCYTFGSKKREPLDVKIGRKIALKSGQKHEVIFLDNKFFKNITEYIERAVFLSDGYISIDGATELYVNSIARSIAPVRLTGNYGSELLRGIRAFKYNFPRGNLTNHVINDLMKNAGNTFNNINTKLKKQSFVLFHQAPFQGFGRRSIEFSQLETRTPFMDNDLMEVLYKMPTHTDGFLLSKAIIVNSKLPELFNIATDRGYWGTGSNFVKKLRHYYRQATFKAEYLAGRGSPDLVVKSCFFMKYFGVERLFMYSHKFYDERLMIRDYLTDYIKSVLLNNTNAKYLSFINEKNLRNIIDDHIKQKKNYMAEIDKILALALIENRLFK